MVRTKLYLLFNFLCVVCPLPLMVTAPWIIAVAIIAALLVAGIVALILLKVFLYIIVR